MKSTWYMKKHMKKKNTPQPYKCIHIGDRTDVGTIINLKANIITVKTVNSVTTNMIADHIKFNYSRMKRQAEKLKISPERAPSRRTSIRDLSKFLIGINENSLLEFSDLATLDRIILILEKYETMIRTKELSTKFGI